MTVLGGGGQWRTRKESEAFLAIGVEQVTVWVTSETTDAMRRELDTLAAEIFGAASV